MHGRLGHGLKQEDVPRATHIALKNNLSYPHYRQRPDYGALRKVFLFLNMDLDYTVPENKYLFFVGGCVCV